jgi:hypothetical protein
VLHGIHKFDRELNGSIVADQLDDVLGSLYHQSMSTEWPEVTHQNCFRPIVGVDTSANFAGHSVDGLIQAHMLHEQPVICR